MSTKRVVLVGDAANLVDPFSGEGIYAAIKSGRLAAEYIAKGLNTGNLEFSEYTDAVQKEFTSDYHSALRLGKAFYYMPVTLLNVYRRAKPLHRYTEQIVRADMDYQTAILKSLKQAPKYIFKRAVGKLQGK
jgi:flavin-dependent dehydrogenase